MRAHSFMLLGLSCVYLSEAALISPSMLHHGPISQQVTLAVGNRSQVYHLYTVTYATAWSSEFCAMAASASAHGFRLNVLGEGRQQHFQRDKLLDKLWTTKDFVAGALETTPEDMRTRTVILFLDAYDVLVNGGPRTLVRRFVRSKKRILFSAEKGCCGTREAFAFRDNQCDPDWPVDQYTTTPFLNSGVYIGYIREVDRLLTAARNEYEHYLAKLQSAYGPLQPLTQTSAMSKGPWDPYLVGTDQLLFCQLFAHEVAPGGRPFRSALAMSLDYESQIFVSLYNMQAGRELVVASDGRARYQAHLPDCDLWSAPRLQAECRQQSAARRRSATAPVILHFNGPHKHNMTAAASRMRWPHHGEFWESDIYSATPGARRLLEEPCALHSQALPFPPPTRAGTL